MADDRLIYSPAERISPDARIRVREYYKARYVSKGGLKLEHAFAVFGIVVRNKTVLDCGASTGGFTDCLLTHGAKLIYAVDTGYGQLAAKLLHSSQVINMEKTNLSDARLKALDPKPELITLDLSYLSLKTVLDICIKILSPAGEIVALIKPIFEVQSGDIRRSGKINDPQIHHDILIDLCIYAVQRDFQILNLTHSPVRGNSGVIEYFIYLKGGKSETEKIDEEKIDEVIKCGFALDRFRKT